MIIAKQTYKKDEMKAREGAFTIGNGYIHIRGSLDLDIAYAPQNETYWRLPANVTVEEARQPYSKWGVYIPGIVGNHPLLNEEMVNLPYLTGFNIYMNHQKIKFSESLISNFEEKLDMEASVFEYHFDISLPNDTIHVYAKRYADWNQYHRFEQTIKISSEAETELGVICFIDTDITTNGYHHFISKELSTENGYMNVFVETDAGSKVAMKQKVLTDNCIDSQKVNNQRTEIYIHGKNEISIQRITAIYTNLDQENPKEAVSKRLEEFIKNHDQAFVEHVKACKRSMWLHRIFIEGDPLAQKALDFSVYHLLRSKSVFDTVAIDAKGAAGEAYFGHYFWDTEIYLLPFFLYTEPDKAKDLLMFRVHTLQAAMDNAKAYGYKGAKYPWESSISGIEQCPNWQYKDHEIHVSFDIVYAMQEYYQITHDIETCQKYFLPVVKQVALFTLDRSYTDQSGNVHLNGVMGPDEYIMFCNDNYYTNKMAQFAVKTYINWMEAFGERLAEDEKNRCLYFIEHLTFYEQDGIFMQCENFDKFEDIDFNKDWKNKAKAFGAQISQEKNYRSKALKQADVLELFYLFDEYSKAELQKNMDYYMPITTHDSSLSYVIHSILFCKQKEIKQAYTFFKEACNIDFDSNGAAEGIHIANAGGLWQAVVFGFLGLKNLMWNQSIELHPNLPESWKKVSMKIYYQETLYQLEVDSESIIMKEVSEEIYA